MDIKNDIINLVSQCDNKIKLKIIYQFILGIIGAAEGQQNQEDKTE